MVGVDGRRRCEACDQCVAGLHAPVNSKPVETDGAARAAREIVAVMENRSWAAG